MTVVAELAEAISFVDFDCYWYAESFTIPVTDILKRQTGVAQSHRKCNSGVLVVKNLLRTETTRATPCPNTIRV